jgi:PadR family transcriptional regulator, regulatory protein PadR
MMSRSNPEFMNGVPELLVLALLSERERYGYELVQAIEQASGQALTIGEGVIYPTLHALERAGCLRAKRRAVDGRTRIYYAVTARGRRRLAALSGEWTRVSGAVETVVRGAAHASA